MKMGQRILLISAGLLSAGMVAGCASHHGIAPPPPVISAVSPHTKTYTTTFSLEENPISEDGLWIGGRSAGLDWGSVWTNRGVARGHAGPKEFADSVALLAGSWPADQTVEAVVEKRITFRAPEVSLRVRSSLEPHRCTGYEVSEAVRDDDSAYLIIVRWNGPLADFTYLLHADGKQYGVRNGDVVKAAIAGNVIRVWKNGVLIGQAKDSTWQTGQPGFGFNEGNNGEYGITRFTVSASDPVR